MRSLVLLLSLLLAGCAEAVLPPTPIYSLGATSAWAGGALEVRSSDFRGRGDGATLRIGAATLPLNRVNDTTLSATLPQTLSGNYLPTLQLGNEQHPLPSVMVAGLVSRYTYADPIEYNTVVDYRDGHPIVLGATTSSKLGVYDLDQNTLTTSAILNRSYLRGPGPTADDGVFLMRPGEPNILEGWRVTDPVVKVRTFDLSALFGLTNTRAVMQMSENAWFIASNHQYQVFSRANAAAAFTSLSNVQAEETEGVHLSPRKDRATIQVDYMLTGNVPVFNAVTGAVAYQVPQLRSSAGVAFSRDGSLLAMVGTSNGLPTYGPGRVVLLDAGSGAVMRDTTFDRGVFAVALDPDRPWLYVGVHNPDTQDPPVLLVLDRASFRVLGELAGTTPQENGGFRYYRGVIAPSSPTNSVYLFWYADAWKFSLPPK